jgi:uncharacterized membrane protein
MSMITGIFPVVGFVLSVIGLILILRAMGIVNRSSPFFTYRIRIGGVLVFVGVIIMVLGIII